MLTIKKQKVYKYEEITITIILKMDRNAQRELKERRRLVNIFLIKMFKMQYENITRLIIS
jgi:hypothetical protein